MPANEPKAQHYVHRAYLEGFEDPVRKKRGEPALWVYLPNKKPFPQRPDRVAKRNYYYCFDEEEQRQFRAEYGLQTLENLALPMLETLRAHKFRLADDDRLTFAGYVALAHTRVPTFERNMNRMRTLLHAKELEFVANTPKALKHVVEKISEETGEKIDLEDYRAKLVGGTVVVEQKNRGWTVRQMFETSAYLQDAIFDMKWTFLVSGDDSGFLTSDNPVSLFDPVATPAGGIGFASSPAALYVPNFQNRLSSRKTLGRTRHNRSDAKPS